jgi:predicted DNA repair protein MutK
METRPMAGATLLALLDDITTALDDIAAMTKIATRKTAGVLGDDLALNAHQVSGIHADRELPVVWGVAKGSLVNKAILVPAALALSAFAPWAVPPLLVAGGLFLCYEGAEKLVHVFQARNTPPASADDLPASDGQSTTIDPATLERTRIRGAIRTDFVLSAEVIVIALGTVATAAFATQLGVLVAVALGMTIFVYGLVAGIVKLDDAGLALLRRPGESLGRRLQRAAGRRIVDAAPVLMRILSVVGTAAMFLVGGGILVHAVHRVDQALTGLGEALTGLDVVGPALGWLLPHIGSAAIGFAAGLLIVGLLAGWRLVRAANTARASRDHSSTDRRP